MLLSSCGYECLTHHTKGGSCQLHQEEAIVKHKLDNATSNLHMSDMDLFFVARQQPHFDVMSHIFRGERTFLPCLFEFCFELLDNLLHLLFLLLLCFQCCLGSLSCLLLLQHTMDTNLKTEKKRRKYWRNFYIARCS